MTTPQSPAGAVQPTRTPTKIEPGSELHLTLLMAPYHLNFVVGEDRKALLAWGRDVWKAAAPAAPAEVLEVLEKLTHLADKARRAWAVNPPSVHGLLHEMRDIDEGLRAALAEIEAMKGKTLPPHAEGGRDGADGVREVPRG